MIDSTTEEVIPLTQAASELPRRRRGRKTHVSTLYRWATHGCRGVLLETIQIGATRCTSRQALSRFFSILSDPDRTGDTPSPQRTATQRQRQSEAAGKLLDEEFGHSSLISTTVLT